MTTTKPSAPGGAASPPLSRLLDATATALQAIRAGQSGTAALDASDAALRPAVQFSGERLPTPEQIGEMHHEAHDECFIARSVRSEVRCEPVIVG